MSCKFVNGSCREVILNSIAVLASNYKQKVKVHPVQALRLFTGRTAHKGSRGIAVLYRH